MTNPTLPQQQPDLSRFQAYFTALLQASPQPIYVVNLAGEVLMWNQAAERVFGWTAEEVIGRPLPIVEPEQRDEFAWLRERSEHEGGLAGVEVRRCRKDGTPIDLSIATSLVRDEGGALLGIVAVATDITTLKASNRALSSSEARFRLLAEHAQDIIFRYRLYPDQACEYVSPAVKTITGHPPQAYYADPGLVERLVLPADQVLLRSVACLPDGQPVTLRLRHPEGRTVWVEQRTVLIRDEQGRPVALEGISRDITERVAAQVTLDRYRLLSEHARDIVLFACPHDGRILEANSAAVAAYGYSHGRLLAMTLADLQTPATQGELAGQLAEVVAGGTLYETEHIRADGSVFPIEVSATMAMIDGEATLMHVIRDISGRRHADAERDLLRAALAAAANAVVITDPRGQVEWANPAFTTLTGYEVAEVLGQKTSFLRSGRHDDAFYAQMWANVLAGSTWRGELVNRRKDGRHYVEEMTITPVLAGGQVAHFVAIKQEVTARVEQAREREALLSIAEAMRQARTRAELSPILLDQMRVLLGADAAALAIREPASGDTFFELGQGAWEELAGLRLPAGVSVTGRVIATGELYRADDVLSDTNFVDPSLLRGVPAAICAPMRTGGTVIGALWAGRRTPLSPAEARLVAAIADLAANAIQRATLSEQTERRLRRLVALRAIDQAITGSIDLRLSLDVVLDQALQQLGVDAAAVLLLNSHSLTLEHAAGRGFRTNAMLSTRLRLGEGLPGAAALERRTIAASAVGDAESGFVRRALIAAEGFESYIAVPLVARGRVRGVLEVFHRVPLAVEPEWLDFLETLAGQAAVALDNAELFEHMQRANIDMALAYDTTLEGWSRALELRDKETEGHSQRVTELTVRLARAMGLHEEEIVHIRRGALLHDIGKMGIPDAILLKPGPLTPEERAVIKLHPGYARELLRPIAFLRPALDIPYCHHEKWDGSGYPRGLKGEEIPLAARIFAAVDVYDAVTSDRPYQTAWSAERARRLLREEAGRHFDPQVVAAFLGILDEGADAP